MALTSEFIMVLGEGRGEKATSWAGVVRGQRQGWHLIQGSQQLLKYY